jgi:type I restriction enzyme S subunit
MIEEVNLADVCDIIAGQSPPSSTYNQEGNGVPFFQGKADFGKTYPTVRYWCNSPKKMSKPDDILFSVRAPVGPTNINNINACIGRGLAAIRCNNIERNYLLHYLRGNEDKIASLGSGSTFKAITIGTLKELKIPLPPLDQQKKIAAILDAADTYRQKTKALITKYDELTQSLFLDMFGDPFSGDVTPLKDNISIVGGFAFKSRDFVNKGIPLIKIGTVNKGYFEIDNFSHLPVSFLPSHSKWIVKHGDILVSLTGTVGKDDYGNVEKATEEYENYFLNQRVAKLEPSNHVYLKEFIFGMFSNNKTKKELTKISRGVRQANISNKDIENLKMITPLIKDQKKYISAIATIEAQKTQAQASLVQAEDLFNSLLQKAFKGELV